MTEKKIFAIETAETNAIKLLTNKLQAKKWEEKYSFSTAIFVCKGFWQITFAVSTFPPEISTDLKTE